MSSSALPSLASLGSKPDLMLGIAITLLVLCWIAVTLRVFVRAKVISSFGWDDATMVLTLLLFTVFCGCIIKVAKLETGPRFHQAMIVGGITEFVLLEHILTYVISAIGFYLATTAILKISLALLFLRIVVRPYQRYTIIAATVLYFLFGTALTFLAIFQCGDPKQFLLRQGRHMCVSNDVLQPMTYLCGALNAATDWLFAVIAVIVVWQSSMPRPTKLTAGFLLTLGALGSICSIARLPYIPGLLADKDFFTNAIDVAIWSIVEPGLGIVAASLSTLRPLFRSVLERTRNISPFGSINASRRRRDSLVSSSKIADRNTQQVEQGPEIQLGNTTTVFGNARDPGTIQLTKLGYDMEKVLILGDGSGRRDDVGSPISPLSPHGSTRTWSTRDSHKTLSRDESRHSLLRACPSPSRAWVSQGRVVMSKQVNALD